MGRCSVISSNSSDGVTVDTSVGIELKACGRLHPRAWLGIRDQGSDGVRGGVRFTLVSTVSFTLGYAANPHSRPNEGPGAFFFSLTTRNLFE